MPRVTKKQKEAGHPVKPKSKPYGSGAKPSSGGSAPGGERRKGFQVGPNHAPRDAYLGRGK
jgi:hypothetical protein